MIMAPDLREEPVAKKVDVRITRTRHLLVQALQGLLEEKCFEDITIQDILEKSTVNRATFYAHFDDKQALLRFILSDIFDRKLRQRLAPGAKGSRENLTLLILGVCDFLGVLRKCPQLSHVRTHPSVEAIAKPVVHRILLDWAQERTASMPEKKAEAEIHAAATAWAVCGAALQWSRATPPIPAEDFAQAIYPVICPGTQLLFGKAA